MVRTGLHAAQSSSKNRPSSKVGVKWGKIPEPLLLLARRGPLSNKAMPRPTPRTTSNRSSNGSRTLAQVRRKVLIGYHGAPQIRPQIYPFPNPTTYLIPAPIRPTIPNLMHIRLAVLPQCAGQTERPTDRYRGSLITI